MRSRIVILAVMVVVSLWMSGCGGTPPPPADTGEKVDMKNVAYVPANMTISKGTKVTWTNSDSVPHTVTSDDASGPMKSQTLQKAGKYSVTFDTAGTFKYHCEIKPHATKGADGNWTGMVGTITVTA